MPEITRTKAGVTTKYTNVNEFPVNVKKFVNQLSSIGVDNIVEIIYAEFVPNDDVVDEEPYNEIDIDIKIDAEDAARNKSLSFISNLKSTANNLAQYFNIDSVYIYTHYENKELFAKKFLKQLKTYLKTTESSSTIHSIGFDVKSGSVPELRITKKRDSWRVSNSNIKQTIQEYLVKVGYPHIKIYFVN